MGNFLRKMWYKIAADEDLHEVSAKFRNPTKSFTNINCFI